MTKCRRVDQRFKYLISSTISYLTGRIQPRNPVNLTHVPHHQFSRTLLQPSSQILQATAP